MKLSRLLPIVLLIASFSLVSCDSDRDDVDDSFSSMDSFYDKHKQEEQEFVVDTGGTGPIIGKMGTKLWVDSSIFMFPGGGEVEYPFIIKLIELYPEMDLMFYEQPTIAGGQVTHSAGVIKVTAWKNGTELVLRPNKVYAAEMPNTNNLLTGMSIYEGTDVGGYQDWAVSSSTQANVITGGSSYSLSVPKMGWINNAQATNFTNNTTIKIKAKGTGTENIDVFVVFKDIFSVAQIYNLESGSLPIGEEVTIVAMAMDQNNDYRLHKDVITISANKEIELDLKVVTEADLLSELAAL